MITITGTVGNAGKYLVTGEPIESQAHTPLKISFENKTSGTNLGLIAGTVADFESGSGGKQLVSSGGPGFQFLTIVDLAHLYGKILFVRRNVGSADAHFVLTVE